jgi:hypothetical protein
MAEQLAVGSLDSEPKDLLTSYRALTTLAALGRKAPSRALSNALAPLAELKANKGRLRLSSKAPPSLMATAYGYLTVAAAHKVGGIPAKHTSAVGALLAAIPQVWHQGHCLCDFVTPALPADPG